MQFQGILQFILDLVTILLSLFSLSDCQTYSFSSVHLAYLVKTHLDLHMFILCRHVSTLFADKDIYNKYSQT